MSERQSVSAKNEINGIGFDFEEYRDNIGNKALLHLLCKPMVVIVGSLIAAGVGYGAFKLASSLGRK